METEPDSNIRKKKEVNIPPGQLLAKGKARAERIMLATFVFLAVNILVFGYINYQNYSKHFRQNVNSMLAAISDLKATEIKQYINERLIDGSMFFRRHAFYDAVLRFLENPEDAKNTEYLREWLDRYAVHYQYRGFSIVD